MKKDCGIRRLRGCAALLLVWWLSVFGLALSSRPPDAQKGENPPRPDPELEILRLRMEGVANYEAGIFLKTALTRFESALALAPNSPVEMFNLATTKRKLGDLEEARILLMRAIGADPKMAHSYYTLGLIERLQGNYESATRLFEKVRQLTPAEPSIYYQLALLYAGAGRDHDALQALIHALALNPYHTGALYQMVQYHREAGNKERAAEIFKEFSRLKRAALASRRQINYDEGPLSTPFVGTISRDAHGSHHDRLKPAFTLKRIPLSDRLAAYELRNVGGDMKEDLILATTSGQLLVLVNEGRGHLSASSASEVLELEWQAKPLLRRESTGYGHRLMTWLVAEVLSAQNSIGVNADGLDRLLGAVLDETIRHPECLFLSGATGSLLLAFDADHDGDLDLLTKNDPTVWVNRGNGQFYKEPAIFSNPQLAEVLRTADGVVAAAFRRGGGVDLLVYRQDGQRVFVRDSYAGKYEPVTTKLPRFGDLDWVAAGDFNNDGLIDLISLAGRILRVELNRGSFHFERQIAMDVGGKPGTAGVMGDFDNDGYKDVMLLRPNAALLLGLNEGQGRLALRSLLGDPVPPLRQHPVAVDLDGDGRLDIVALTREGQVVWWRNVSTGTGNWVKIKLQGVKSPASGAFTQVETRAGHMYQKYESPGRTLHIGLGKEKYLEVLRITWPNGFVENKLKVDGGNTWTFKESERISGSCPSVFPWNGQRFEFVTDAFISGPMGVPIEKGRYFPVDQDEYIKIPGERFKPDGASYRLRITEELREATYLDQVRLFAVDHPAEVAIYPNERLGPFPFPQFKIHSTRTARAPYRATDQRGSDVLDFIRAADGRHVDNVKRAVFAGFAEPHWVEFDLPRQADSSDHLRLFLTGWFYYFDSTSLTAASQQVDMGIGWPEIQEWKQGSWKTIAVAGLPPGKHKTIVVDVSGKLSKGTTRLRVYSNIAVYWDAILIDAGALPNEEYLVTEAPLRRGWLQFRGFSALVRSGSPGSPDRLDYDQLTYTALWNPLKGKYTKYGAVEPLLAAVDSYMVVFGSGDELLLEFDGQSLPALPQGWKRDFLLYLNGYVKDGDRYTAYPGQLTPMPFAGMEEYPYVLGTTADTPFETSHYERYLAVYQTRGPFRFVGPPLSRRAKISQEDPSLRDPAGRDAARIR